MDFDTPNFSIHQYSIHINKLKENFIDFELSEIIKYLKIQYFIYQHQLILTLSTSNIGKSIF